MQRFLLGPLFGIPKYAFTCTPVEVKGEKYDGKLSGLF